MNQKNQNKPSTYRFKRFARKAYSAFNSMHRVVNIGVVSGCMLTFAHVTTTSAQSSQVIGQQEEKVSEKELDEVTVTASRVELNLNQTARLVTIITKQEIAQAPVQSIQDLLNYATNIDVVQRGGHGVQADISIRGGSFDQTAILLNGINLSSPHTGHYSFDIPINLSDIERIEIIHGPSSLTYGASAFSGGINIITNKKPDHKAYASVETGGHQLFKAEARGVVKNSNIVSQLSAGYNTSNGYTKNSDYDIFNLLWQNNLNIDNSKIDVQVGYNNKKYGANTFYSPKYPNQYDKTDTYLFSVSGETGSRLKFLPKIYWTRHNDCFQLIKNDASKVPYNYHRSDVYGANLNLQYKSDLGITSFGSEFRNEGIISTVLGKPVENPSDKYTYSDNRTNVSFALEHNVLLRNFTMSVGVLSNYNTFFKRDYNFYPNINLSYRIFDNLKVYTSWSKAMRLPTFTDLYYNTKTHSGNTNLKPENSESLELGFKFANYFMQANISAFYMEGKNMIDWVKAQEDEKWHSVNISKIYKAGIETTVKVDLNKLQPFFKSQTNIQLGYTRLNQHSSYASGEVNSAYALTYLRDKFTANLNLPLFSDITLNAQFRWQKRMGNYIKYENGVEGNLTPYSSFSTLDLKVTYQIFKDLRVYLSTNNLYDTHYYDLGNIPQSGFWLSGGVSYFIR